MLTTKKPRCRKLGLLASLTAKVALGSWGMDELGPVELPIEGALDLHTFQPREVKDLVPDYLEACRQRGILRVRIIHGKGTGNLRRTVHAILGRLPMVVGFSLAGELEGSWGATIVFLHPPGNSGNPN